MPPKVRVSKEDILRATLEIIRQGGEDAVNARSIADALECSTQPIFREFSSIDELVSQTKKAAYSTYIGFIESEVASEKYPAYKAFGMNHPQRAAYERWLPNWSTSPLPHDAVRSEPLHFQATTKHPP